jgi:hypothetical protein
MKKLIVFLIAFAMVFGFTVTAAMADAELYGSIRFRTYWADQDKEYAGGTFDNEDLEWRIGHLSRWGVKFKSGDVTGRVELDARAGLTAAKGGTEGVTNGTGSSGLGDVRLRHLYGEWSFGAGKLLIGQTFNPCTVYLSGLGYYSGGMQKFGGMGLRYFRTSMIQLTFGNLKLAFMTPDTSQGGLSTYNVSVDTTLPRMEARYTLKVEPVTLDFMGGWQTYDIKNNADQDKDITSYIVGLAAQAKFGPGYVKAIVDYRQNGGNYGMWTVVNENATWKNGDVSDADCLGYGGVIGYKVSDMVTLEAGYMKADAENDDNSEDEAQTYGVLAKITLAPGVVMQPEIVIDDQEDVKNTAGVKTEEGDAAIFGVFWVINFK